MTIVSVQYRIEPEGVWAESDDLPGFVASGESLEEVRSLVAEGVPFYASEEVEIREEFGDTGQPISVARIQSQFGDLGETGWAVARPAVEFHANDRPVVFG